MFRISLYEYKTQVVENVQIEKEMEEKRKSKVKKARKYCVGSTSRNDETLDEDDLK